MRIALLSLALCACSLDLRAGPAHTSRPQQPLTQERGRPPAPSSPPQPLTPARARPPAPSSPPPPTTYFVIPDVHGLTPAEARVRLQEAGFRGRVKEHDGRLDSNCALPVGLVCVTSPRAGREMATGGWISLMLASDE